MSLDDDMLARLSALEQKGLRRQIPAIHDRQGVTYRLDGRQVVGFCSNDYLGFHDATDPDDHPTSASGASGSRLISGDTAAIRALERDIADLLQTPAALFFPSGYQANVAVLPALLDANDHVYSDAANHASLIDGLRLAAATKTILPHLTAPPNPDTNARAWWIVESRYSMDADAPDPEAIRRFMARGGRVYLDEAHSLGLYPDGRGWADAHAVRPHVRLLPFGKAFGSMGAAVGASRPVIDWLANRARGFVFSTGPSPRLCDALRRRIDEVRGPDGDARRERLYRNVRHFAVRAGLDISHHSPIIPLPIGDNDTAVAASRRLLDAGFHVQAIRPPTVPTGTARLRLTLSAAHRLEHIDALVDTLADLRLVPGAPPSRIAPPRPASP